MQGSGSNVLDHAAAVAAFPDACVRPFPLSTPAPPADVVLMLHYSPADGGV